MLTRSGRSLLVVAVLCTVVGRLLGFTELVVVGVSGVALVLTSVTWLKLRKPTLTIKRQLSPPVATVGEAVEVQLAVTNTGRRTSPIVELQDSLHWHGRPRTADIAHVSLAPLKRHRAEISNYVLQVPWRGLMTLGPMDVTHSDPFGLCRHTQTGPGQTRLLVFPKIDPIPPPVINADVDPLGTRLLRAASSPVGDEFTTLRSYVPGDDLRQVHWATSARRDALMVRQYEQTRQVRTTILLDVKRSTHTEASFEAAVSAAASIANAAGSRGDEIRLLSTHDIDSLAGSGPGHLHGILRELALVSQTDDGSLSEAVATRRYRGQLHMLVVVTSDNAAPALKETPGSRGSMVIVSLPTSGPANTPHRSRLSDEPDDVPGWGGRGRTLIDVDGRGFVNCWSAVMRPHDVLVDQPER